MCVRSVFVLVFMCCVNSRAQWDPSNSPGYTYTSEHSGIHQNGMPPQSGTIPGFSKSPENPDKHPQIMTVQNGYSDDSDNPSHQGMLSPYNPSSGLPDEPKNPYMHPQGRPPPYGPSPGLSDERKHSDIYPQGMTPQYDPFSRFPNSPNNPYMHPQRRPPPYGPSPGLSGEPKNSDIYPQGMAPQYDPSSRFPDFRNNPYMPPQRRPPPYGPPPGLSNEPKNPNMHPEGIPAQYDPSPGFPNSPNNPYMHPQGRHPQHDPSSGYSDNSDNPHLQPHGMLPQYDHSSGLPNAPENPDINPQGMPPQFRPSPGIPDMHPHKMPPPFGPMLDYADDPEPPDLPHRYAPVQHAGLPRKLEVFPLPLENSDHELKFNVSWIASMGGVANGYSLEVWSLTETIDCQPPNSPTNLPICYEYNIAGNVTWSLIPALSSTVAETCAIRPGCAYNVKLMSHPWDGHTTANLLVELDECVDGVCSCAHSPRLPVPVVSAQSVTIKGEIFSNISWTLPTPSYPQRLPSAKLGKQSYVVSLGKQMVTEVISSPWFANIMTHAVDADGFVSEGDTVRSILFPISRQMELKVKLLARVKLVDERGCVGPAGNATVFDPEELTKSKFSFGVYAILGALIGAWAMGAVFVLSARVVKRVLKSFRTAPVSAPLEPPRRRPAWFPLQLRT